MRQAYLRDAKAIHPRDLEMMGMLLPLGIQKGKDFNPDAAMKAELRSAAQEAHAWLVEGLVQYSTEHIFGPDSKWVLPTPPISATTLFKWTVPDFFDVDSRGIALATPSCPIVNGVAVGIA